LNRHVNAIAGRLSLRPPQRRSLEMLDRITEIAPPRKGTDAAALTAALEAIRSEFPSVTDFDREFPSLCFALATGDQVYVDAGAKPTQLFGGAPLDLLGGSTSSRRPR